MKYINIYYNMNKDFFFSPPSVESACDSLTA